MMANDDTCTIKMLDESSQKLSEAIVDSCSLPNAPGLGDLYESCKDHMVPRSACSECVRTSGQSSNSKPILTKQVYRAIENLSEIFDKYIATHPNAYQDYG